ncbi:MAG: RES family NAD+ phosphorylase [Xenococcaceae cyanobacterium MO_188.B19]|nr:RES family NAD+ phosphorylase [Xenococcaceae cyanobacterium MO_188.B19]
MYLWRICAAKYQDSSCSGLGGLYAAGRWHQKGNKIIYTAESLALATLEIFVHLESDRVPLVAIKAQIDDDVEIGTVSNLRANWQEADAFSQLQ